MSTTPQTRDEPDVERSVAVVTDAGGGFVTLGVTDDMQSYPPVGAVVSLAWRRLPANLLVTERPLSEEAADELRRRWFDLDASSRSTP